MEISFIILLPLPLETHHSKNLYSFVSKGSESPVALEFFRLFHIPTSIKYIYSPQLATTYFTQDQDTSTKVYLFYLI
jgi:hypothetical protein